jgi:hypothetical protein
LPVIQLDTAIAADRLLSKKNYHDAAMLASARHRVQDCLGAIYREYEHANGISIDIFTPDVRRKAIMNEGGRSSHPVTILDGIDLATIPS